MTLLAVSFLAGALTVLAPCILPLLPVVLSSSAGSRSRLTPLVVITSLAVSIFVFTLLLKASTAFITIPPYVWSYLSGTILVGFGLLLTFPGVWESLPLVGKASVRANKALGSGHQKQSLWGDVVVGASLGPVFSTCSPTYFVILATILPASFWLGVTYLLAYIVGLVLVLGLIAVLGQRIIAKLQLAADGHGLLKRFLGLLFITLGLMIMTGLDKDLEAWLIDIGAYGINEFEQELLDSVLPADPAMSAESPGSSMVDTSGLPEALTSQFSTDWQDYDSVLEAAVSGGPPKDGIPALTDPDFIPLADWPFNDTILTIVLQSETDDVKVYPYNILTWHEIVNDTSGKTPVAVTFCPLCGSAIVFNRTLPDGSITTFGVTGSLLESNMIMYDRTTESLWQQSTGAALAGTHSGATLDLVPMQLMMIKEAITLYPEAQVLSAETGHSRNYTRNPYAGYDEQHDAYYFVPSTVDTSIPPKTIVVVARIDATPVALPWVALKEVGTATFAVAGTTITATVSDSSTVEFTDETGTVYPFYFEMWFSYAVQHGTSARLITL